MEASGDEVEAVVVEGGEGGPPLAVNQLLVGRWSEGVEQQQEQQRRRRRRIDVVSYRIAAMLPQR